jgi:hypothetical protein
MSLRKTDDFVFKTEEDILLKRSLQNWATQQTPPAQLRYHVIKKAVTHNTPPPWFSKLSRAFDYHLRQVSSDRTGWAFVRVMGYQLETDAGMLRVVS